MESLINSARNRYHSYLLDNGILTIDSNGIPSNADKASALSVKISRGIADILSANVNDKIVGQTAGAGFEAANMAFLRETFLSLDNLRPGTWHISKLGNRNSVKTSSFYQYSHLDYLNELIKTDSKVASCLGNTYLVAPDIVIFREPVDDKVINLNQVIVDDRTANRTAIRSKFNSMPILHASISAKWTMRSDRAQNSRTEALGLIRNRKGNLPHIVAVTGEPMPSRIASLALGTGDIDCMYHFALYELIDAVNAIGAEDAAEMLDILISGQRLKDISDLPLDLAV